MKKSIGVIIVLVILAAVGFGVWYFLQQSKKPLSKDDLESNIESVQAIVSEGSVLANLVSSGKTTSNFTKVHANNLSDNLRSLNKQLLSSPPESSVKSSVTEQRYLISSANSSLRQLSSAPGNQQTAKNVYDQLGKVFLQEGDLGRQL